MLVWMILSTALLSVHANIPTAFLGCSAFDDPADNYRVSFITHCRAERFVRLIYTHDLYLLLVCGSHIIVHVVGLAIFSASTGFHFGESVQWLSLRNMVVCAKKFLFRLTEIRFNVRDVTYRTSICNKLIYSMIYRKTPKEFPYGDISIDISGRWKLNRDLVHKKMILTNLESWLVD